LLWTRALADQGQHVSNATPVTAIPGVLFLGSSDGRIFGVGAHDGQLLWSYDSARPFDTVNGVAARGGGMSSQGIAVAGGMLFAGSGYSVTSTHPGNVLLAFGTP
jgi:polyvinyl alcohol dehydrogenase (cytochrome)